MNIFGIIQVSILMNDDISTSTMVFSYQKNLDFSLLLVNWPPKIAFFFVAIVDEMMQLASNGLGMIQETPQNIFSQIELDIGWLKEWYSQKSCFS